MLPFYDLSYLVNLPIFVTCIYMKKNWIIQFENEKTTKHKKKKEKNRTIDHGDASVLSKSDTRHSRTYKIKLGQSKKKSSTASVSLATIKENVTNSKAAKDSSLEKAPNSPIKRDAKLPRVNKTSQNVSKTLD